MIVCPFSREIKIRGSQEPVIAHLDQNNATALWRPSWWESATAGHNFGKEPSNDYSIKV